MRTFDNNLFYLTTFDINEESKPFKDYLNYFMCSLLVAYIFV